MVDILYRDQWGASAPLGPAMRLPAVGVHVHHSVTRPDDPVADMQELERIGVSRFGRFSYSYAGHPSGVVGEGAGLTVGAHTAGWNSTTFGFCLIGNYDVQPVTDEQVRAFVEWRQWMVANGWLVPGHWIEPHQARASTACPGANTIARWHDLIAATPPPIEEEDDMAMFPTPEDFVEGVKNGVKRALEGIGLATADDVVQVVSNGVLRALESDRGQELLGDATVDVEALSERLTPALVEQLTPALAAAIPDGLAQTNADVLAERLAD